MKLLFALFALLCAVARLGAAQYVFEQDWDYTSFDRWPNLCKVGSRQSPISFSNVDVSEVTTDNLERLEFSPQCLFKSETTNLRIINLGFMINVTLERPDTVPGEFSTCSVVDPRDRTSRYYFSNIHFHLPSEHKFRTLKPDVELHMEFLADPAVQTPSRSLIVSIMLKASSSINSTSVRALRHMLVEGRLPPIHSQTTCTLTEDLSMVSFLPSSENYLMYEGSQTYPPCTEDMLWVVMTTPVLISRLALGKLRDALDATMPNNFHRYGNIRPPQALNNRRIYRFVDSVVTKADYTKGHLEDAWDEKHNKTSTSKAPKAPRVRKSSLQMDVYMVRDDDDNSNSTFYDDSADLSDDSTVFGNVSYDSNSQDNTDSDFDTVRDNRSAASNGEESQSSALDSENATLHFNPVEERHNFNVSVGDNTTDDKSSSSSSGSADLHGNESDDAPMNTTYKNNTAVKPLERATSSTTTTTTSTPTTTTTTSTSTTTTAHPKKEITKKLKKGSSSIKDKKSNAVNDAEGVVEDAKEALSTAGDSTVDYIKEHPKQALTFAVLGFFALVLLLKACCCRTPAFVVSPEEVQPLNKGKKKQQYGTNELP